MFVILIAAASFVGVACLVAGVWSMLGSSQTTSAEVRLQAYANGRDASASGQGASGKGLLSSPLEDATGLLENFAKRFNLRKYLDQADMRVAPAKLLLIIVGLGVGVMLTSSVNVVQSSFPEEDQGEISGLSRSVSNLGSSLGVAIAGSVLVSPLVSGTQGYAWAIVILATFALVGLVAAVLLPVSPVRVAPAGFPVGNAPEEATR